MVGIGGGDADDIWDRSSVEASQRALPVVEVLPTGICEKLADSSLDAVGTLGRLRRSVRVDVACSNFRSGDDVN